MTESKLMCTYPDMKSIEMENEFAATLHNAGFAIDHPANTKMVNWNPMIEY